MTAKVSLATGRLQLRPWRPADVADVLAYANDSEFARYLEKVPIPYSIQHAEEFVSACVSADWRTDTRFAISLEGQVVGGVDLWIDPRNAIAETGYAMARQYWNSGYMTEAIGAVIAWAFQSLDLSKVWADCDIRNIGSWRVLEKVGMHREGFLRSHRLGRGERFDVVQYGLLREDWRARAATQKQV